MGLNSTLARLALFWPIRKLVAWSARRQLERFDEATHHAREVQESLLQRIVSRQAETGFGRDHGFGGIRNPDDFRRQVPIRTYDDLEPYLAQVRQGNLNALVAEPRVHMFAMTSGTTANRKYIPVTDQYLRDYKKGWNVWGLKVYRSHPAVRLRPLLQLSGDWDEFRSEGNIPCGALTGLTAHTQKRIIRWLYCMPAVCGRIKNAHAKYYVALRLSMHRKVGLLIAANPSTLLNLARTGDQDKESLLRDLHDGTLKADLDLPADVRSVLNRLLKCKPARARELEAIANRTGTLYPKDYWGPYHIGTWTGGSMGAYLQSFPRYFGDAPVRDIGLVASEGRMTIPVEDGTPSGVLDVNSHYFEFLPEDQTDAAKPDVLCAHEVEEGKRYFILPTTSYGLYRYNIHDLVQVTGFYNRTPLIQFLSKGAHFSNITGEKLSEYQVTQSMDQLSKDLDLNLAAYSLAPCWDDDCPYYGLFLERSDLRDPDQGRRLAQALDRRLYQVNSEYASKRDSLRLAPVRLELIPPGAWQEWDRQRLIRTGGSLEQYKHPCLINDLHFRKSMPVEEEIAAG